MWPRFLSAVIKINYRRLDWCSLPLICSSSADLKFGRRNHIYIHVHVLHMYEHVICEIRTKNRLFVSLSVSAMQKAISHLWSAMTCSASLPYQRTAPGWWRRGRQVCGGVSAAAGPGHTPSQTREHPPDEWLCHHRPPSGAEPEVKEGGGRGWTSLHSEVKVQYAYSLFHTVTPKWRPELCHASQGHKLPEKWLIRIYIIHFNPKKYYS